MPWRTEWIVRRNPGVFTVFAITHFMLFLLLLLIFWQGIQAKNNGRIIDAYLSATPRELLRFTGGLLAVVLLGLRHLPAADGAGTTPPAVGQGDGADPQPAGHRLRLLRRLRAAARRHLRFLAAWIKFFIVIVGVSVVGGVVGAFFLGVWIVVYMSEGLDRLGDDGPGHRGGQGLPAPQARPDGGLTIHSDRHREARPRLRDQPEKLVITSSGRYTKIPIPAGPCPRRA